MNDERIEYEFDGALFMLEVRRNVKEATEATNVSLRDIEAATGLSASSFSRIDNGAGSLDMPNFLRVCSALDMPPGQFFKRVVWVRKSES